MEEPNIDIMVTLTTQFATTRETLWRFWTIPSLMQRWFGSDPKGTVLSAQADVRVGGAFSVTFQNANGTEYTCAGSYLVVEPFERLEFTWFWKGRESHVETISLVFADGPDGVTMTFVHSNIDPATTHGYEAGWRSSFEKLRKAMALG